MSMRQRVGREEIEHFLLQVGRTRPGLWSVPESPDELKKKAISARVGKS